MLKIGYLWIVVQAPLKKKIQSCILSTDYKVNLKTKLTDHFCQDYRVCLNSGCITNIASDGKFSVIKRSFSPLSKNKYQYPTDKADLDF